MHAQHDIQQGISNQIAAKTLLSTQLDNNSIRPFAATRRNCPAEEEYGKLCNNYVEFD